MKRFYETVTVGDGEGGHAVLLDGRAVMTPRRQRLLVPRREIASMIADEWARQGEDVDPESMPAMRARTTTDTKAMLNAMWLTTIVNSPFEMRRPNTESIRSNAWVKNNSIMTAIVTSGMMIGR